MGKTVLVVGGTGYLGGHLRKSLIKRGFEVYYTGSGIKTETNYYTVDFNDKASFFSLKDQTFNLVIILAAKLDSISTIKLDHADLSINTIGYASFLQYLKDNTNSEKVIFSSSMTVYSTENDLPVKEESNINPVSTYGLSKYLGENITTYFAKQNEIPSVILRLPGIYGGEKKSGFIYNTIYGLKQKNELKLSTENLAYWETIHIDDLCEMMCLFIQKYTWEKPIDVFNIGYGVETDFYEVANFIKDSLHVDSELFSEAQKGYQPLYMSNQKLKQLITFNYSFQQSLSNYIMSFK